MSLLGRVLGGRYEVIRLLGTGGMGAVYEAKQLDLARLVAIKVLHETRHDPADLARFRQEAQAAAGLAHPNIVQIIDFVAGTEGGDPPFIVMELLRGRALSTLVRTEGALDPSRAVALVAQLLAALGAAHRARIVHRDVKPENVFVCDPSSTFELVKVLDFGFAKPLDAERRFAKTQAGYIVGTPAYMAPEQAAGAAADARMDLYAAGITLYFALSGRRPFDGPTTSALLYAIRKSPPIPLSAVMPQLDLGLVKIVERSIAKEPSDRFGTAEEFMTALGPFQSRASRVGAAPATSAPPPKPVVETKRHAPRPRTTESIPPKSSFRTIAGPIAERMVRYARFSPNGASAMAVGPSGLAKWAGGAWAGRPLPPLMHAEWVRGFEFVKGRTVAAPGADRLAEFMASGVDSLLFGIDGRAFFRDARSFRELIVGDDLALLAAHADHEASVFFAAVVLSAGGPSSRAVRDAGLGGGDGAILHVMPSNTVVYPVGRNVSLFAITRASGGEIVAAGERGSMCIVGRDGATHARAVVPSTLSAIAPVGGGVIAAGKGGAAVHVAEASAKGLEKAAVQRLAGPNGPVDLAAVACSKAGHVWAGGGEVLFSGPPNDLRLVAAGGALSAPIVTIWAGEGRARVLLENASILELDE